MDDADVVVVGMGISTAPVIESLVRQLPGARIVVVERGRSWDVGEEPYPTVPELAIDRPLSIPVADDRVEVVDDDRVAQTDRWWSARPAGGGSLLWYGQLSRFRQVDLRLAEILAGRLDQHEHEARDWPIAIADLEPHYREIERWLAPTAAPDQSPGDRPQTGRCEHVTERLHTSLFEQQVGDHLRRVGFDPRPGVTCLGGRTWDAAPVDPLTLERYDDRRPLAHRSNPYAKTRELLQQTASVRVIDGATLRRVVIRSGRVHGIDLVVDRPEGAREQAINAPVVVLGCGALETTRVLLDSQLPDPHGLLGRRFTFSSERVGYISTDIARSNEWQEQAIGSFASLGLDHLYELPDHPVVAKGGKITIYDAWAAELPNRHVRNLHLRGRALTDLLRHEQDHLVLKVSFKGESIPWAGKRVMLGRGVDRYGRRIPRVSVTPHGADLALQHVAARAFATLAEALPGGELHLQPEPRGARLVSAHQHGGVVFGDDPADSILDPSCEARLARGLFVVDGSFMPTSGATNASLTLMANARRVAGAVVIATDRSPS